MMRMENRLVQTQSQRLMLTQKMQQALQILQYSGPELEQHIQQELESNPVLDQIRTEAEPPPAPADDSGNGHDSQAYDDTSFDLDAFVSPWERRIKEGRDLSVNPDLAARRDYYETTITKEESLTSRLLTQLRLAVQDDEQYRVGERIVGDIDDRGYFTGSVDEIAQELDVPAGTVERMLYRIQRFEPTGVGARDVVECLLLQINAEYPEEEELKELVEEHLDDLQLRQIPKIAKEMGIAVERVNALKALLATLNPWPGEEYSLERPQYIEPELVVEKVDDEWVVQLAGDREVELKINSAYRDFSKQKDIDKSEKSYLKEKIESANWLIRNIEQRRQTILKIGKAIMDVQQEFLEKGVKAIKPLTLQEIADVVGVHEATVSRATRGKYIQTPQGLLELKYFFSPGLQTAGGDAASSKSVQARIEKIVEVEDKHKPLSDQKIADQLKTEGVKIARRTVTKYREALGIPATSMRKEY